MQKSHKNENLGGRKSQTSVKKKQKVNLVDEKLQTCVKKMK